MYAIVNHLPIKDGTDWSELAQKVERFQAGITHAAFRGMGLIRASDTEAIVLVLFTSREVLDDIARNVAAPWFAENIRPYLAGPVSRSVGEIVAGSLRGKN